MFPTHPPAHRPVTLIQRFGSAANLNIHLHCLVLDGVYRRSAEGAPQFVEAPAPTDEVLQAVLHRIINRLTQAAHPSGGADGAGRHAQVLRPALISSMPPTLFEGKSCGVSRGGLGGAFTAQ